MGKLIKVLLYLKVHETSNNLLAVCWGDSWGDWGNVICHIAGVVVLQLILVVPPHSRVY